MTSPRLTIVTASRDRHDKLLRKLDALACQTLRAEDFEWRIFLNEPVDAVEGLRCRIAAKEPAFSVTIDGGEVLPVGHARNLAAVGARGGVLLLSDDDCMPDPGALQAHLALHERLPGTVGIGALKLPQALRRGSQREPFERAVRLAGGRALWINLTGANSSLPVESYREVGGYDPTWIGYGGEDPEFALRLRARGLRFRHVPGGAATHEGRVSDDTDKAYAAGGAHVRVARRYPRSDAAWMLGVHPTLLAAKRLWLGGPFGRMLDPAVRAYECAYADGAAAAWQRPPGDA